MEAIQTTGKPKTPVQLALEKLSASTITGLGLVQSDDGSFQVTKNGGEVGIRIRRLIGRYCMTERV